LSKELEGGCSPNTVKAYRHDLKLFNKTLTPEIDIKQINQIHIRFFLKTLKDREFSKTGIARKIACLKSFFNFLEQSEVIVKNPMKKINSPRIKREESLPKFLKLEEMKDLIEFVKKGQGIPYITRKRIYIIIRLLYATLARVSEIANLKIGDIDFTAGLIRLRGKGNKERIVPIDQETLKVIREYLMERIFYSDTDPLLVNKFIQPLSVRVIQKDIQIVKKKFGFNQDKKLTPHIFRHTGATHLRQAGMDISELQDILGHSSPNTTKIYAKNDISQIKKEYEKMHPLNKLS
ncbi:MAG: tyrosine-type recombinase/integrase, partial [archaeon]|nr:tyrosine-type recombinase/integrase [archaeon]